MSERFASAERVSVWTSPKAEGPAPFVAWGQALRQAFEPPQDEFVIPEPAPALDLDAVREEAMEQGFAAGLAAGRAEALPEREALARLAAALDALKPEPTPALGSMIAATVERLLVELMGQVAIDRDLLAARAEAAAALIDGESRPVALRLHPDDCARMEGIPLPVPAQPDPTLEPGGLRIETGQGWIEDTPSMRLETLRGALDRVAAAR